MLFRSITINVRSKSGSTISGAGCARNRCAIRSIASWDIDGEGSRPSTPAQKVSTWQQQPISFDDGPRTAPLFSTTPNFPFALSTPSPAIRKHHRAPSDGVFSMSLDEDSSPETPEGPRNLFNDLLAHKRRADGQKMGYFASSQFQNSPSPEDLPAPDFIH